MEGTGLTAAMGGEGECMAGSHGAAEGMGAMGWVSSGVLLGPHMAEMLRSTQGTQQGYMELTASLLSPALQVMTICLLSPFLNHTSTQNQKALTFNT